MCGIVGLVGRQDSSWIDGMNGVQAHRGPDDAGVYRDPEEGVALAMRRLSILDLAGGHQPMSNEDGSVWIVFNGEIFNAGALRAELVAQGHTFSTDHSDTEVLVHLYEQRGHRMVDAVKGMFSFVLHDRRRGRLFGARDHAGIKPLYYAHVGGRFAFASEPKSLLTLPWVSGDLDPQSLFHYLSLQFVPGPASAFRQIRKVPAGHLFELEVASNSLRLERYWEPRFPAEHGRSSEEWAARIRAELSDAVSRWTLSDVSIACSLSGGIDSATVVGLMAEQGLAPRTYSLGFGAAGAALDERALARQVANRWGLEHHEIVLEPESLLDDLEAMVWHLDEPYGGGLPSWYVFRAMGKDVKVAMTGTGGDELFGNYLKWRVFESPPRRWRQRMLEAREQGLGFLLRHPHGSLYPKYFRDGYKRRHLLSRSVAAELRSTESLIEEAWSGASIDDPRNGVAYVDFQQQLPEEFLLMTDRFSMAHSVEARVPLLDRHLVELVQRVPARIRTSAASPKGLLLQAVGDLIPEEIRIARKRGFVLPLAAWLRGRLRPLVKEVLGTARLREQGLFRPDVHTTLVRPHLEGSADHASEIWTLLMFQLWHRRFVSGCSA